MNRQEPVQGSPHWLRRRRLIAAGAAAVILVIGFGAFSALRAANLSARMMRTDPDLAALQPDLVRYAAAAAKPVFAQRCASCHGADMKGDHVKGVPNLVDQDWLYGSGRPVEIEKTILYGIRSGMPRTWNLADMPAFGEATPYRRYKVTPLTPGQITDVIEFVRLIEHKQADPVAAARGGKVFADTGQCFDCHAADGFGDTAIGGPNLQDDIWLYGDGSRKSLYQTIAHGRAGICPSWSRRLKPAQVRSLAIYISNAAKASKPGQTQAAAAPQQPGKPS